MISRTTAIAAVFAILTAASLAGAAELRIRSIANNSAATRVATTVQLPTVVVTAKRIPSKA